MAVKRAVTSVSDDCRTARTAKTSEDVTAQADASGTACDARSYMPQTQAEPPRAALRSLAMYTPHTTQKCRLRSTLPGGPRAQHPFRVNRRARRAVVDCTVNADRWIILLGASGRQNSDWSSRYGSCAVRGRFYHKTGLRARGATGAEQLREMISTAAMRLTRQAAYISEEP
jgi:hypothetical protein